MQLVRTSVQQESKAFGSSSTLVVTLARQKASQPGFRVCGGAEETVQGEAVVQPLLPLSLPLFRCCQHYRCKMKNDEECQQPFRYVPQHSTYCADLATPDKAWIFRDLRPEPLKP